MEPASLEMRGSDGLRLHLLEWSREGPPLLFLHGFGHSARVWDDFVPDVAPRHRTLALDARGHGDSEHDPGYRYHHAGVARDIEAVIDALGLTEVTLVGHSMGGYASIRYAAHHADRVVKLVLVDAGPELAASARVGSEREPTQNGYADAAEYARALARSHPGAAPATLERLAHHWLRPGPDGRLVPRLDPAFLRPRSSRDPENRRDFDRARWAREETERLWRYLAKIRCPTLVVRGERSPILSAETTARMLKEVLHDGREAVIPGAGHAVMLDAPAAFRSALTGFLER